MLYSGIFLVEDLDAMKEVTDYILKARVAIRLKISKEEFKAWYLSSADEKLNNPINSKLIVGLPGDEDFSVQEIPSVLAVPSTGLIRGIDGITHHPDLIWKIAQGNSKAMLIKGTGLAIQRDAPYLQSFNGIKGGIDFNSANLNLLIKRDGRGVPLPVSQQNMAQLSRIQGFFPEILKITAAWNLSIVVEIQQKLQASAL